MKMALSEPLSVIAAASKDGAARKENQRLQDANCTDKIGPALDRFRRGLCGLKSECLE